MHLQHIFAYSYMQYIMCIYAPYIDIYYIYNAQYTFLVCDRILQQTTVFSGRSRVVTEALVWILAAFEHRKSKMLLRSELPEEFLGLSDYLGLSIMVGFIWIDRIWNDIPKLNQT